MQLTALFVQPPVGNKAPLAIAVEVTPTNSASHTFIEWLHMNGVKFHDDTYCAYIPAADMEKVFTALNADIMNQNAIFRGFTHTIEALLEEVDTFEEPLDCYITAEA